jgi:GNAT superfamily N-acetyltransferase
MDDLDVRTLDPDDLGHLASIDPTETGAFVYRVEEGAVVRVPETWRRPPWNEEHLRHHTWEARRVLGLGGVVLGAFDGGLLVGYATLRPDLEPGVAQLADMQVSHSHRRRGIARRLIEEVIRRAREGGAGRLYVSSCPSESAVGLYRSLGFGLVDKPHPDLFELEPEDVHMIRDV